jgi:EAL domain-containing protein (putative c-di-GMP-specific phosphodiesterase class I)
MSAPTRQTPDFSTRLATAIAQGAVQACFQPIVDAQSHRVVSCEVVPCWHDAVLGHVMARDFLPLAQELGLLDELGLQVWAYSLECLQAWCIQNPSLTQLSNVSRQQFHAHGFSQDLANQLNQLGIALSSIDLEIVESVAMEDGLTTMRCMAAIREAGFGVVIGEFGSGNTSFSHRLGGACTGIRIDAISTRRVESKVGEELIAAIVKVAQTSNLQTIAAGVEDAETAALLALLGVQRLQGRYFGEPMDRQSFEKLLAQDGYAP